MKKILFFSNIFSLAIILSACGSSGTPQAQGEGADEEIHITNPLNNVSETERTITLVPDNEPRTSAQTAVSGSTPSGSTVTFGTGTFTASTTEHVMLCQYVTNRKGRLQAGCRQAAEVPYPGSVANRHDVLANVTTKIDDVVFQARLLNINQDSAGEYKVALPTNFTADSDSIDSLKQKMGQVYDDTTSSDLEFPINFNFKFSADNVDVNASQIDTACFKEDFVSGNFDKDELFRPFTDAIILSPIAFYGDKPNIPALKDLDNIDLEFRFTAQLDCIESTSKFDVTYEIDVDSAPGGDVDITVTADLGEVTFAPILVEFVTIRGDLLGSTKVEAPNTFGTDKKIIKVGVEACSDGRCIGPFDESTDQNVGLEQETTNIKTALLGLVFRQGTQGATVKRDGAIGVYRRAVERITSNTSSNDYKCGTYSLDPIGEGNLEVTHVGTDGDNENYKITLDFVSTANPCSRELVYQSYKTSTFIIKELPDKYIKNTAVPQGNFRGRAFDFPKVINRLSYDDRDVQEIKDPPGFPADRYEESGTDPSLLTKTRVALTSYENIGSPAITPQSDALGNPLYLIDQSTGSGDIWFRLPREVSSIGRFDVSASIGNTILNWSAKQNVYFVNATLDTAVQDHEVILHYTNYLGETLNRNLVIQRNDLDDIYIGCIFSDLVKWNNDETRVIIGKSVYSKKPWFYQHSCPSDAPESDQPITVSELSFKGLSADVSISETPGTFESRSLTTINITENGYTGYNYMLSSLKIHDNSFQDRYENGTAKEFFGSENVFNDLEFKTVGFHMFRSELGVISNFIIKENGVEISRDIEIVNKTDRGDITEESGKLIQSGSNFTLNIARVAPDGLTVKCIVGSQETSCENIFVRDPEITINTGDKPGSKLSLTLELATGFSLKKLEWEKNIDQHVLFVRYEESFTLYTSVADENGDTLNNVEFLNVDGDVVYTGGVHETDKTIILGEGVTTPTSMICFSGDIANRDYYDASNSECEVLSDPASIFENINRRVRIRLDPRQASRDIKYYAIGDTIYVTYEGDCSLSVNLVFSDSTKNRELPSQNTNCARAVVDIIYPMGDSYVLANESVIDETVIENIERVGSPTGDKLENGNYSVTINFRPNVVPVNTSQVSVGEDAVISGNISLEFFKVTLENRDHTKGGRAKGDVIGQSQEIYLPFPKSGEFNPSIQQFREDGALLVSEKVEHFINATISEIENKTDGREITFTMGQSFLVSSEVIPKGDLRGDNKLQAYVNVSRSHEIEITDDGVLDISVKYKFGKVLRSVHIAVRKGDDSNNQKVVTTEASKVIFDATNLNDPFAASEMFNTGDPNNPVSFNLDGKFTDSGVKVFMTNRIPGHDPNNDSNDVGVADHKGVKIPYDYTDDCEDRILCMIVALPEYSIFGGASDVEVSDTGTERNLEDIYLKFKYKVKLNNIVRLEGESSQTTLGFDVGLDGGPKYTEYLNPIQLVSRFTLSINNLTLEEVLLNGDDATDQFGENIDSLIVSRTISDNIDTDDEYLEITYTIVLSSDNDLISSSDLSEINFINQDSIFGVSPVINIQVSITKEFFYTNFRMKVFGSVGSRIEQENITSPAGVQPTLSIGDIMIFRDGKPLTDSYIPYVQVNNNVYFNTSGAQPNSKDTPYEVNATLYTRNGIPNIGYSSYELERTGNQLSLTINLQSLVDTSGWVKYIKVFESRLAQRFDDRGSSRNRLTEFDARLSSNLLLRNERGGFNFYQSVCNDQKKVEVRDDKEHAYWTLCSQIREIRKMDVAKRYSANMTRVHTGNTSLDRVANLEIGIDTYLSNTASFPNNRALALLFQDKDIVNVISREGRLSDSVVIIPVAEDSRRRETNEIPCPFSYVESCRQLDREDRIVFVQGVIKITDEYERYELNATNADDEGYYKYSKSGCSSIDKCFSVSVDWESVNNLPPHNGVASVYYAISDICPVQLLGHRQVAG